MSIKFPLKPSLLGFFFLSIAKIHKEEEMRSRAGQYMCNMGQHQPVCLTDWKCRQILYPQHWPTSIFLVEEEKVSSWEHILCSCSQREQWALSIVAICWHTLGNQLQTCISVIYIVTIVQCSPKSEFYLVWRFSCPESRDERQEQGLSFLLTVEC